LPVDLDVVLAFALLIHVERESLQKIFHDVYEVLNPGGFLRISMKQAVEYV